jgi:SAM-dependent methyltransferase
MKHKPHTIAAEANKAMYDSKRKADIASAAGHLRHAMLKSLFGELLTSIYNSVARHSARPTVLDLGAGEGTATLPLLKLGAIVSAVDISKDQLNALQVKCADYSEGLEVLCGDALDIVREMQAQGKRYDIVVAISFLHHIPDYLGLIQQAATLLKDNGCFFSFQDPLRYDTISKIERMFSIFSFLSWRIFQGNVIGGVQRRIRRSKGVYLDDCIEDNYEYHVVRNGVDQNAIRRLFEDLGLECKIICYFSTISRFWQAIGAKLGIRSSFAVIAGNQDTRKM